MTLLGVDFPTVISEAIGWGLRSVVIHQTTPGVFEPSLGDVTPDTTTNTTVPDCAFADSAAQQYRATAQIQADERIVLLLQKPLSDASITLTTGDELTLEGTKSEILRLLEDPDHATFTAVVKP